MRMISTPKCFFDKPYRILELIRRTKEQRSRYLEDLHVFGYLNSLSQVLRNILPKVFVSRTLTSLNLIMLRMKRNIARIKPISIATVRSTSTVKRKVEQDGYIPLRPFKHIDKMPPLAHVICHDNQAAGKGCHRNQRGPFPEKYQYQQERQRMDHPGDRSSPAVFDIGGRARNGPRSRNASEQRRKYICGALCHQFHIRPVIAPDHSIRNDGRQERLNAAQQGNGERRLNEFSDRGKIQPGNHRPGQGGRNLSEFAADALDGQVEQLHNGSGQQDGYKRTRNPACNSRPEDDNKDRRDGDKSSIWIYGVDSADYSSYLFDKARWNSSHFQSQKILYLRGEDDKGDTAGETYDQRVRNEFDDGTKPGKAHNDQHHACDEGCDDQPVYTIGLDDAIDDHDKCPCRTTDLHPAAPQCRDGESRNRGKQPFFRETPKRWQKRWQEAALQAPQSVLPSNL